MIKKGKKELYINNINNNVKIINEIKSKKLFKICTMTIKLQFKCY